MIPLTWAVFGLSIIVFDLARRPVVPYDFLRLFNIFFVIYFPLQGLLFSYDYEYWTKSKYVFEPGNPLFVFLLTAVSYVVALAGYYSSRRFFSSGLSASISERPFPWKGVSILLLCTSFTIVCLYVQLYGGWSEAIALSKSLRSGYAERHDYAFLKRFFWVGQLAFLITGFRSILVGLRRSEYPLLAGAFLLVLVMSILLSSRGFLVTPFALFAILYAYTKGRILPFGVIVPLSFVFLFILIGDQFWDWVIAMARGQDVAGTTLLGSGGDGRGMGAILSAVLKNFQAPYVSLEAYLSSASPQEPGVRVFDDFFLALASLTPEKVTGISVPPTIATYNTYLVQGEWKSVVPPGLVAFSLHSMSWLGVVFYPFILGAFGAAVTVVSRSGVAWRHWWVKSGYAVLAFTLARSIGSGEPRVLLIGSLDTLFMLLFVFMFGYVRLRVRKFDFHRRPGAGEAWAAGYTS